VFITKESDYAVRIIRALSREERRTARALCEEELVPRQYGYKILKKLENAGLLRCFRGATGGYSLAKPVTAVTLLDIIQAIDDELLLTDCLRHGFLCPQNTEGKLCQVHSEFERIQNDLTKALKKKSLAEILGSDTRARK
jgi:Rrf2 family protein